MKFISTRGREYSIDIRPSRWKPRNLEDCKSKFQWRVGNVIAKLFPTEHILEDFAVPGEMLYIDFFIPRLKLAIEADGEQHGSYNSFYHRTPDGYKRALERDARKSMWCQINGVRLVRIAYDDDDVEIISKIRD